MQSPFQAQFPAQAQVQYVGVGRRFFADLVDGILLGIVIGVIGALSGHAQTSAGNVSISLTGTPAILAFVFSFLYLIVLEATLGATLGKLLLGIRVVKEDGSPIGWGTSIVRNLLRIIDALPTAYILGAILIWTSPRKQRLGDRVAHTVVVRR
jgi:uncharacterized RDD family membrane protein YckC